MASLREILLRQEAERKEKIKSENESFLKAFIAAAVNGEFRVPQAFVVSEWLRSDGRGEDDRIVASYYRRRVTVVGKRLGFRGMRMSKGKVFLATKEELQRQLST